MNYILVFAPYLLEGGYISKVFDVPFDSISDALLYLKCKKYKKLNIDFKYYEVEYKKHIPDYIKSYKIYNVFLSHHEFSIGYMLIEIPQEEVDGFIGHFRSLPVYENVQYLDVTFDIKNNHIKEKKEQIVNNHYLEIGDNKKPIISYYKEKQLEYQKPLQLENEETKIKKQDVVVVEESKKSIFNSYYIKSKNLSFDAYDLYILEEENDRFFVKKYYYDSVLTRKMVVINEFLFLFFEPIIKHPINFYAKKGDYLYRFSKNIFDTKIDNLFNNEYNFEPFDEEFIILNSILHYFHIGIASKPNLIKYNNDFYMFDIWGNLLLEYVNYYPNINYVLPEEIELLKKINHDIDKISEKVYNRFNNIIDKKELNIILSDTVKAVVGTIDYLIKKEK